jgi:cell division septation protein DedD
MENKKLLWIIFSAVLFVAVVVSVGLLLFWPSAAGPASAERRDAEEDQFDPIEWVRGDEEYPGIERTEESVEDDEFVIVYGESGEEQTEEGEDAAAGAEAAGEESAEGQQAEAAGEAGEPGRETSPMLGKDGLSPEDDAERDEPTADRPIIQRHEPKKETPTVSPEPRQPAPEPERAADTAPKTVRIREYWIQAGSYTSKTRAENVKEELAGQGIASRITTKQVDSDTFFRVRIGPYANQAEAEKFLGWLKGVRGFESSYVSQVYTTRRVN